MMNIVIMSLIDVTNLFLIVLNGQHIENKEFNVALFQSALPSYGQTIKVKIFKIRRLL